MIEKIKIITPKQIINQRESNSLLILLGVIADGLVPTIISITTGYFITKHMNKKSSEATNKKINGILHKYYKDKNIYDSFYQVRQFLGSNVKEFHIADFEMSNNKFRHNVINELATKYLSAKYHNRIKPTKAIIKEMVKQELKVHKAMIIRAYRQPFLNLKVWCEHFIYKASNRDVVKSQVKSEYIQLFTDYQRYFNIINVHHRLDVCYNVYELMKKGDNKHEKDNNVRQRN